MPIASATFSSIAFGKLYDGCEKCYQYSLLFGELSNSIGKIHNEEEFEIHKMQFVEHFNEKHRDIYEKRKKSEKPRSREIKKLPPKPNSISFSTTRIFNGIDLVGSPIMTSGVPRPALTAEDANIIVHLERNGTITMRDKERIDKKYGKSKITEAYKKFNRNRRGFRA